MTKSDIVKVVKKYDRIRRMIQDGREEEFYYAGNRKKYIQVTQDIRKTCEMIEEICAHIQADWKKQMIRGILKGKSDVYLMQRCPCGRSMYYSTKREFIELIYRCCIAKQMVAYEELLETGV